MEDPVIYGHLGDAYFKIGDTAAQNELAESLKLDEGRIRLKKLGTFPGAALVVIAYILIMSYKLYRHSD